jgi:hypothetical protein
MIAAGVSEDAAEQAQIGAGILARAKFEAMLLEPQPPTKKARRRVDRALAVPDFKKICEHVLDKKPQQRRTSR